MRKIFSFVLLTYLASFSLFAIQTATADEWTESAELIQSFGCCHDGGNYKIMLKFASGNRYFVWYPSQLGASIGATVVITFSCSSCSSPYWEKITYPETGKESDIDKVLKVN